MERDPQLFDTTPFEDPYRAEAMGDHPPLTREQFMAFCDELHDCGDTDMAATLFDAFGESDEVDPRSLASMLGQ